MLEEIGMKQNNVAYLIGIIGKIGSGKSLAGKYLRGKNHIVLDSDQISRELTDGRDKAVISAISEALNANITHTDGSMDRKAVAEIVFRDEQKRKALESIIHPAVWVKIKQEKECHSSVMFVELPLIPSEEYLPILNEIWLIEAGESVRLSRVISRDGLTEAQVLLRMQSQDTKDYHSLPFTRIIRNDGTIEEFYQKLDEAIKEVL